MITITKIDASTADYVQYRVSGDNAEFLGPAATDLMTDSLYVKSVSPKRGNNQYGNRRGTINLVRGTSVLDVEGQSVVRNRKITTECSNPVGTTLAELTEDCANMASLLTNATFVQKLFQSGIIEH